MIRIASLTLVAGLLLPAAGLSAQSAQVPSRNVPDNLVAKAKIGEDSARAVALKRLPGTVETVNLMERSGKLEYVFGIKPTGNKPMENVSINAMTAHVISVSTASTKSKSTSSHSS